MKRLVFYIVFLLLFSSVFSQSYEEKLAFVKKTFIEIEGALNNYTEKIYLEQPDVNYPPSAKYSFYYDQKGHLKKALKTAGEEGYYQSESYYFDDEKLFFYFAIFKEPEWIDGAMFFREDEARIYFYDEVIFEYLYKAKEPENTQKMSEIKNIKGEWDKKMQDDMLESATNIIEIAEKSE